MADKPYDFNSLKYQKGCIKFTPIGSGEPVTVEFLTGPSAVQEQRSNSVQIDKTMSGWFISRTGAGVGSLTLSGFLLDCKESMERLEFLEKYKNGAEDVLNSYLEYSSEYMQSIEVEGIEYFGFIQSLALSKAQSTQYAYNFSISFGFIGDNQSFSPSQSSDSGNSSESSRSDGATYELNSIRGMTSRNVHEGIIASSKTSNTSLPASQRISSTGKSSSIVMSGKTLKILTSKRGVE